MRLLHALVLTLQQPMPVPAWLALVVCGVLCIMSNLLRDSVRQLAQIADRLDGEDEPDASVAAHLPEEG